MLNKDEILNYALKYKFKDGVITNPEGNVVSDPVEIDKYSLALRIYKEAFLLQDESHTDKNISDFFDEAMDKLNIARPHPTGPAPTDPAPSGPTGLAPTGSAISDVEITDPKIKKIVEKRLVKWESKKEKRFWLSFILRKSKKFSNDYKLIFDNIAVLRAHYPYWSIVKIKDSLEIINNDIFNSNNLSDSERKRLMKEYSKIFCKFREEESERVSAGMEVTQNQSLPGKKVQTVVTQTSPTGPTNPTDPTTPTGPTGPAPTGPANYEQDIEITNEKTKKVVSKRLHRWQSKAEKRTFLEFIFRKNKNHSEDYKKIFYNIAILRAHYELWTPKKIEDSINLIMGDIENSNNLSKKEKKVLKRNTKTILHRYRLGELKKIVIGGYEPLQSESLPGIKIEGISAPTGPAPTGPAPSGPAPSGPAPTGPAPSGPAPSGPAPTGPAPSGPAPTGPAPTGPTPTGPAPSGPAPTGPAPSGPAPTGPVPTGPAPSGPKGPAKRKRTTKPKTSTKPTGPAPSGPTPTDLASSGPVPTGPVPSNAFDNYRLYFSNAPRLSVEEFERLSVEEKQRYLQMDACRAYVCSGFVSITVVMDNQRGFEPNTEDLEHNSPKR